MADKTPSILTIDDDPENLILISKMLKKSFSEITIYSASSGHAGLLLANKYFPDIIILDVIMPDIDGFAVCKSLKDNIKTNNIPIIMITGSEVQMQAKIKALNLGADAFLPKPLREAELIAQIRVMLRIKYAEDKLKKEKEILKQLVDKRTKRLSLLASHTLALQEEERARISRELHDELGQMLIGLQMGHDSLLRTIDKNNIVCQSKIVLKDKVNELISMTEYTFESVRKVISDLRPPVLDHLGLIAAIEWLKVEFHKKTNISITLINHLKHDMSFINEQNTAVFRIIQESLTNIAKHSKATKVIIQIKRTNKNILFEIKDNGIGIDIKKIDNMKNFGILGMQERASDFDWTVEIEGSTGKGTVVTLMTRNETTR